MQGGELDRVGEYSEECMSSKKAGFSKYSKECVIFSTANNLSILITRHFFLFYKTWRPATRGATAGQTSPTWADRSPTKSVKATFIVIFEIASFPQLNCHISEIRT